MQRLKDDWLYALIGAGVLGWLVLGNVLGWTGQDYDEIKNVPKTVRSNPGSYRSHYSAHYHYIGGK